MFCPRCGQQQVSDQTKFCSRCGFQLGLVGELLDHEGFLPQLGEIADKKPGLFTRKNGVVATILWFIFFVMMLPAFFSNANLDRAAESSAIFGVFTSMMMLIVSLAFLPSRKKDFKIPEIGPRPVSNPAGLYGSAGGGALPPQQSQPVSSYAPPEGKWRVDTADLARPGRVTDETTKLLRKEEDR